MASGAEPPSPVLPALPAALHSLAARLAAAGCETHAVGAWVRDALLAAAPAGAGFGARPLRGPEASGAGPAAADARDGFELVAAATRERLLALLLRAIPIGRHNDALRVPTPGGPVRLLPLGDRPLDDELARRDFTVNALALDPARGEIVDPFGGRADLAARALRGVDPKGLERDPLRALRAARLVAELGLVPDAALEEALGRVARAVPNATPLRLRHELSRLLLAPDPVAGLALLRRTGVESALAAGTRDDAGAVIRELPADLGLRLAAWLRGAPVEGVLALLRIPHAVGRRVQRLLAHHPIDAPAGGEGPAALRRLLRRIGSAELEALVTLRRAELRAAGGAAASDGLRRLDEQLAELARAEERARARARLAVDGRDVIEHLGCAPGPRVGRALHFLAEQIAADPSRNERSALLALLDTWAGDATAGAPAAKEGP